MGDCEYTEDKETLTADEFSLNIGPINIKRKIDGKKIKSVEVLVKLEN